MNLVIDIGNTRVKAAVLKNREEVLTASSNDLSLSQLDEIFGHFPAIKRAIVSSVRKDNSEVLGYLEKRVPTTLFDHSTPIPVKVLYKTPQTIGTDRLATAVGASGLFPHKELLIIDLGTAITVDYVSMQAEFLGGNISPGMMIRFKALHELTHRLPLESPDEQTPHMGQTTSEAIRAGVQNSISYELSGYIDDFRCAHPEGIVVLTGGDANFFAKTIKYPTFVICNLAIIGLHTILEYNATNS